MTVSYLEGADAALVLQYGTVSQTVVSGLNKISGYSLERTVITAEEFRNTVSRQFAGGAKLGNITYGGNALAGDTLGQAQLKAYLKANTKFDDARIYFNLVDFCAPDPAQDGTLATFQVIKHNVGETGKDGLFPFDGEIIMNGWPCTYYVHMSDAATPTITFTHGSGSTEDTIVDSASGFVTAGFVAGQSIRIDGGDNADKCGIIKTVAAGLITMTEIGNFVADAVGSASTVIHGGLL